MDTLTESPGVEHARRELEAIGQFAEDEPFAESILAAIRGFETYPGHSGTSHQIAVSMLTRLLNRQNLGPLTNRSEEWYYHDPADGAVGSPLWQNTRNSACFSTDGGKTYYSIDDPDRVIHETVTFA